MTLNVTVATEKCIYQCADYQMIDIKTRMPAEEEIQKIFVVNCFTWSATVCYSGVARYRNVLDVEEWFAAKVREIKLKDSFDILIEQLLQADEWLHRCGISEFSRGLNPGQPEVWSNFYIYYVINLA